MPYRTNSEVNGDYCFLVAYMGKAFQGWHFKLSNCLLTCLILFLLLHSLMGNIIDKGPSVVFVKDFDGHIFGGFASTSWTIAPQFKGLSVENIKPSPIFKCSLLCK